MSSIGPNENYPSQLTSRNWSKSTNTPNTRTALAYITAHTHMEAEISQWNLHMDPFIVDQWLCPFRLVDQCNACNYSRSSLRVKHYFNVLTTTAIGALSSLLRPRGRAKASIRQGAFTEGPTQKQNKKQPSNIIIIHRWSGCIEHSHFPTFIADIDCGDMVERMSQAWEENCSLSE